MYRYRAGGLDLHAIKSIADRRDFVVSEIAKVKETETQVSKALENGEPEKLSNKRVSLRTMKTTWILWEP